MARARQIQGVFVFFGVVIFYYAFTYPNWAGKLSENALFFQSVTNSSNESRTVLEDSPCVCFSNDTDVLKVLGRNQSNFTCLLTINVIGRLGNMMGEYATLYALAPLNRRLAYQQKSMSEQLGKYFNLSMPVIDKELYSKIQWKVKGVHDWMLDEYKNLECAFTVMSGYPCSWTFFHHIREQIKKEFTFKSDIIVKVQTQLWKYRGKRKSVTFVGIHVRRGDYVNLMQNLYNGVLADDEYFEKATNYFRERHPDSIFIVCSDDLDWCKKNINSSGGDVYFGWDGEGSSAGHDMALLTQCNHTIMSMGTFGFWTAYLTGGHVVYLNNFTRHGSKFNDVFHYDAAYLPEWHGINANLNSTKWI